MGPAQLDAPLAPLALQGKENFVEWTETWLPVFQSDNCEEYLFKDVPKPEKREGESFDSFDKRVDKHSSRLGKCRANLIKAVGKTFKNMVLDSTKPPVVLWAALKTRFNPPKDGVESLRLWGIYDRIEFFEGEDVNVVITKFNEAAGNLEKYGETVDPNSTARRLLSAVEVVNLWTAHCGVLTKDFGKGEIDLDGIMSSLTAEQYRLDSIAETQKRRANRDVQTPQAGAVQDDGDDSYDRGNWKARAKCFNCKKVGHVQSDCKNPCALCKKPGHVKRNCPGRTRTGPGGNNNNSGNKGAAAASTDKNNEEREGEGIQVTKEVLEAMAAQMGYSIVQRYVPRETSKCTPQMTFKQVLLNDHKTDTPPSFVSTGKSCSSRKGGDGIATATPPLSRSFNDNKPCLIDNAMDGAVPSAALVTRSQFLKNNQARLLENEIVMRRDDTATIGVDEVTSVPQVPQTTTFTTPVPQAEITTSVSPATDQSHLHGRKITVTDTMMKQVTDDLKLVHDRMGHVGIDSNKHTLANRYKREGVYTAMRQQALKDATLGDCVTCHIGKPKRAPFKNKPATKMLEENALIHTDTAFLGFETATKDTCFQIFVEDKHRKIDVAFMTKRGGGELLNHFKAYKARAEKQTGHPIKKVRTDNEPAITSDECKLFFREEGIVYQFTMAGTPQSNAVAERNIGIIVERANAMLVHAKLSAAEHLAEHGKAAILHAVDMDFYLPKVSLGGISPYESTHGVAPDTKKFKVFGCLCYGLLRRDNLLAHQRGKFGWRAIQYIHHGNAPERSGYTLYNPRSRGIIYSRDVTFTEDKFIDSSIDQQNRLSTTDTSETSVTPITYTTNSDGPIQSHPMATPITDAINDDETIETITAAQLHQQQIPVAGNQNETECAKFTVEELEKMAKPDFDPTHARTVQKEAPLSPMTPPIQHKPPPSPMMPSESPASTVPAVTPVRLPFTKPPRAPIMPSPTPRMAPKTVSTTTSPVAPVRRSSARIAQMEQPSNYSTSATSHDTRTANKALAVIEEVCDEWELETENSGSSGSDKLENSGSSGSNEESVPNSDDYEDSDDDDDLDWSDGGDWHENENDENSENVGHAFGAKGEGDAILRTLDDRGMFPDEPRVPKSINDMLTMSPGEQEKWWASMIREYEGLVKMKSWFLRKRPLGHGRAVPGKWVFAFKYDEHGHIKEKNGYKSRWVIKGFMMKKGRDYDETYAPCPRMQSFRILCAIANSQKLKLSLKDVSQAFLHGILPPEIEVLVEQPELFTNGDPNTVMQLEKGVYGTMQGGRTWHQTFQKDLIEWGFTQNKAEPCLYVKFDDAGAIVQAVVVWVDDVLGMSWAAKEGDHEQELTAKMKAKYTITEDEASKFVSIRIQRDVDKRLLFLSQTAYIEKILAKYNMDKAFPVSTPLDPGTSREMSKEWCPTTDEEKAEMANIPYRGFLGDVQWLVQSTRPDLAVPYGKLSRYCSNPGKKHWKSCQHLLRYLAGTKHKGILFAADGKEFARDADGKLVLLKQVDIYVDADYAADLQKRRSSSGWVVLFCGGPVSWRHHRQPSTASSTTHSEIMALWDAMTEGEWLTNVLEEMGIRMAKPYRLYEDNEACITLHKDVRSSKRTKHIEVRYFATRDKLKNGRAQITYVNTKDQLADLLTKILPKTQLVGLLQKMGVMTWEDALTRYDEARNKGSTSSVSAGASQSSKGGCVHGNKISTKKIDLRIDSCATDHFGTDELSKGFTNYKKEDARHVTVASKHKLPIAGTGDVDFWVSGQKLRLLRAHHVPGMAWNLASVRRITQDGYRVDFLPGGSECVIVRPSDGHIVARGTTATDDDPLYKIVGNVNDTRAEKLCLLIRNNRLIVG